jgi:hypothetical protein
MKARTATCSYTFRLIVSRLMAGELDAIAGIGICRSGRSDSGMVWSG